MESAATAEYVKRFRSALWKARLRGCTDRDRLAVFEQTGTISANGIVGHFTSLFQGATFGVATRQGGYRDEVFTLRLAFDDYRKLICVHRHVLSVRYLVVIITMFSVLVKLIMAEREEPL